MPTTALTMPTPGTTGRPPCHGARVLLLLLLLSRLPFSPALLAPISAAFPSPPMPRPLVPPLISVGVVGVLNIAITVIIIIGGGGDITDGDG